MRNKLKPFWSILVIGLFLCFAMASEFLDESTNTEIFVSNCKSAPNFLGNLKISVNYIDAEGFPAEGVQGVLFIVEQRIGDTTDCFSFKDFSSITIHFDEAGHAEYTTPTFFQTNEGDLFRVEVRVPPSGHFLGFRSTKVAAYKQTTLTFNKQDPFEL